jgi:hypothetical protein
VYCDDYQAKHKKQVGEITRKVTKGTREKAKELSGWTKGCLELNTAVLERLNGPFENVLPFYPKNAVMLL